jgi:adenine-specific DNA-methyltransferase
VEVVCQREPDSQLNEIWLQENAWRIVRTCATTAVAKRLADHKRTSLTPCVSAFTVETSQNKLYVMKRDYDGRHAQPRIRLLFAEDYLTVHPGDFWQGIKTTGLGDEGGVDFTHGKKPEALLKRIIGMTTQPEDWVLDAFAGSGTTGAVAHKMGRQWIMIESGAHCHTHLLPRLRRVVDGTDQSGISRGVGWRGGGGFRYFTLADPTESPSRPGL